MRKLKPPTGAPAAVAPTSCAAAVAVPPVASTSSTISTRSPVWTASWCISRASVPYSSVYSTRCVAAGSLPGFRIGTSPAPRASASGAPNRKPRDSIDTTREIRASRYGLAISSTACPNSLASSSTGVTSLNTIPGLGKSFTSRIVRRNISTTCDLSDVKGPRYIKFLWNLKALYVIHARVRRASPQRCLQLIELGIRPFRNHFNRAIGKVAREPTELQPLGFTHDKPPEPDSLNATPDNPAAQAQTGELPPPAPRGRRMTYTITVMIQSGIKTMIAQVT